MKLSILGRLSVVQILLRTKLFGSPVGSDEFGNKYYKAKSKRPDCKERRWVIYEGRVDASDIPAEWHGWLHHQTDVVPTSDNKFRQKWIKKHKGNMTGTKDAYMPEGFKVGGTPAKSAADYVAWVP